MLPRHIDLRSALRRIPPITATYLAAAFVFGNTVLPIAGGPIKAYEVREFGAAMSAFMNGETTTPQLEPVIYPRREGVRPLPEVQIALDAFVQEQADEADFELAALEAPPMLEAGEVTPVAQTFDEENAICVGACGDEDEPLEILPAPEFDPADLNPAALTPS